MRLGVRPVRLCNVKPEPLEKVLARAAFFGLTKSQVLDILDHFGHQVDHSGSIFDVCFSGVGVERVLD